MFPCLPVRGGAGGAIGNAAARDMVMDSGQETVKARDKPRGRRMKGRRDHLAVYATEYCARAEISRKASRKERLTSSLVLTKGAQ